VNAIVRLALVAAALVAAALALLAGAGTSSLTGCSVTWDGGAGTARWHDAANWDTDTLPTGADRACIPTGASAVVLADSGSTPVGALDSARPVVVSAGSLVVGGASTIDTLRLTGGVFDADADVTIASELVQTGGRLEGAGLVNVQGLATLTGGMQTGTGTTVASSARIDGGGTVSAARLLSAQTLTFRDDAQLELFGSGVAQAVKMVFRGPTSVTGTGTLWAQAGEVDVLDGSAVNVAVRFETTDSKVWIDGGSQLLLTSGAEHKAQSIELTDGGALHLAGGAHTIQAPVHGAEDGALVADADVTVEDDYDVANTYVSSGRLSLPENAKLGATTILGGTLALGGDAQAASLDQSGGTLEGDDTLTVGGTFTWTGGVQRGDGVTSAGGDPAIVLGPETDSPRRLEDRLVAAAGGIAWTGGGTLRFDGGTLSSSWGTLRVAGTPARITGSGTIDPEDGLLVDNTALGTSVDLGWDGRPSTTVTVRGDAASLELTGAGDHVATYDLESNGSIVLSGGAHRFKAPVRGAGGITLVDGELSFDAAPEVESMLARGGTVHIPAATRLQTLQIDGEGIVETAGATEIWNLFQRSGELRGDGTTTVTKLFEWTGGSQSGTGTTVVGGQANLELAGEGNVDLDRGLRDDGFLSVHGGLWIRDGKTLRATGDVVVDGSGGLIGGDGTFALDGNLWVEGAKLTLDAVTDAAAASKIAVTGEGAALVVEKDGTWRGKVSVDVEGVMHLDEGAHTFAATSAVDGMAGGAVETGEDATLSVKGKFDVESVWLRGPAAAFAGTTPSNVTRLVNTTALQIAQASKLIVHESFDNQEGTTELADGSTLESRGEAVNFPGATLTGTGTFAGKLRNAGTIFPGTVDEPGSLRIDDLQQEPEGALAIRVRPDAHDELVVPGTAQLGGTLALELAPKVEGDVTIVRTSAASGEFSNVSGDACARIRYEPVGVVVSAQPCLSFSGAEAKESHGPLTFTFTLSRPLDVPVSIAWGTVSGTAAEGEDYQGMNGVATLAPGQLRASVRVPLVNDEEEEPATETMTLRVKSVTGAQIRTDSAVGTIVDDDGENADRELLYKPEFVGFTTYDGVGATAINADTIVGTTGFNNPSGFRWRFNEREGEWIDPFGSTWDINAAGDIATTRGVLGGAVILHSSGAVEDLPMPAGYTRSSTVSGLNDFGWAVGQASRPVPDPAGGTTTQSDPVLWRDGSAFVLDTGGGYTEDVNNNGQVIGGHWLNRGEQSWVWENGSFTDLGALGPYTRAEAINDAGEVVGWSGEFEDPHAFVWKRGTGMVDLGPGAASDINEKHQIVGSVRGLGAVLWQPDGTRVRLADLILPDTGWILDTAAAINDDGVITGFGRYHGGKFIYVLKPYHCVVCVTKIKTEHFTYSTREWVPTDTTTDGNDVRITATLENEAPVAKTVQVAIVDAETGEQIGKDVEDVTLAPDEWKTVTTVWNTKGSAWENGAPRLARNIRVELVDPDGKALGDDDKALKIVPRPVLLVHGLNADASTWDAYPGMLRQVNPGWYGFAVPNIDTSSVFGKSTEENAEALAQAVDNIRNAREAWHVDLLAHSTGGLISRLYVQSMMSTLTDGSPAVTNLVMLGTPNWGSPCAWFSPDPKMWDLLPSVAQTFNETVTERRGVAMSVAAGDSSATTCGRDVRGDGLVPIESALTGFSDTGVFPDLANEAMTHSGELLSQFVIPHLASPPAAGEARHLLAADGAPKPPDFGEPPQLLGMDTITVGAGKTGELWLDGRDGSAVGAVVVGPGAVSAKIQDYTGRTLATLAADPSLTGPRFRSLRGAIVRRDAIVVKLTNNGTTPLSLPVSVWVENAKVSLDTTAAQSSPSGRLRVHAQLTGSTSSASIEATISGKAAPSVPLELFDDGEHGDGDADDGLFSNRTNALPAGNYIVKVVGESSSATRVATRPVRIVVPSPLPPNRPPVVEPLTFTTMANVGLDIHLAALDPDDDDLVFARGVAPKHGTVTLTGAHVLYTPAKDYVGSDSFTYTVGDGQATTSGTVAITLDRRPSDVELLEPSDVREGTTAMFRAKLFDAKATEWPIPAGLSLELDGKKLDTKVESGGEFWATTAIGGGAQTVTLVMRFAGDAVHLPVEKTVEIPVKPNRAPSAYAFAEGGVQRGEAGYSTRFSASVSDPDGNLAKVEWDYQADGVYDAAFGPDEREWTTVYPASFSGKARIRVTDVLGLTAVSELPVEIAPHRPLGPLSRITFDGKRVLGSAVSNDGRWVLFDKPRNDDGPTGQPSELFVLDRTTGDAERAGVLPDGTAAQDDSRTVYDAARISGDGRYVVFTVDSPVPGTTALAGQVYVRDRVAGTTEVASVNAAGQNANGYSWPLAITPDGRYVLFESKSTNLDPRTAPECPACNKLFVRDRKAGTTTLATVTADGRVPANWVTTYGGISADGRYVVFNSNAKVVPEKSSTLEDIFVRDLKNGTTVRLSVAVGGGDPNRPSAMPTISGSGRFVIFDSEASNLVAGDTNDDTDVFRVDRDTDHDGVYDEPGATSTVLVSLGADGGQGNDASMFGRTNCDGSVVTFWSTATNLVDGDGNAASDTFVRDLRTGTTTRISVEPRDAIEGDRDSYWSEALSDDGRYVFFASDATNLVPGDANGERDYFVYDRGTSVDCSGDAETAPVAKPDAYQTQEDKALTVAAPGVLGNDTGAARQAEAATEPKHGTLVLLPTGDLTYTPAANWNGTDTFSYRASDGVGRSEPALVTVTVAPVNDAPVATPAEAATDEDTPSPLALGGTDADGDALTVEVVDGPAHGKLANGVYTPAADFNGGDTIRFVVRDGAVASQPETAQITVRPVNDAPAAVADTAATDEDAAIRIASATLVANDRDADGDALAVVSAADGAHGTAKIDADGLVYRPAPNWNGTDSFQAVVGDGHGGTDAARVTVTVRPVNDAPTVDLAPAGPVDEGTAAQLHASAADVDGDPVTLTWQASAGSIQGRGADVELAAGDGPGQVTVTVRASDGKAVGDATGAVTVRNVGPTASAPPEVTGPWGRPLAFTGTVSDPSAADRAAGLQPRWSFADGAAADGVSATHAFAQPGATTATLTARDKDGGTASAQTAVTVTKRPATLELTTTAGEYGFAGATAVLADAVDPGTASLGGRTVVFRLDGRDLTAQTDTTGRARLPFDTPLAPGAHTVSASFGEDALYLGATAAQTSFTVVAATGKVTGGVTVTGGAATFVANADGKTLKGELSWGDYHATQITAMGVAADRKSAWFAGVAADGRTFVAYVEDNGEPSTRDVFRLWIAGALVTPDGRVLASNLQIH
jgi:probable HAF family extracellular repeat protein